MIFGPLYICSIEKRVESGWDTTKERQERHASHSEKGKLDISNYYLYIFLDFLAENSLHVTNEEQHFVWDGYGLRLHIPHNSLPDGCSHCHLKITVSLSGNFQLPEDGVLVSAVYSFTHDLGDMELTNAVTLEMQHCASDNVLNDLCVLRARSTRYVFEEVPGGCFANGYSVLKLNSFSLFTTFLKRVCSFFSFSPPLFEYCARVYYTNILQFSFRVEIFIIRNLEAIHMVCFITLYLFVILCISFF